MKKTTLYQAKKLGLKNKQIAYGLGKEEGYKVKYSLSPQEFLRAETTGTPERFQ